MSTKGQTSEEMRKKTRLAIWTPTEIAQLGVQQIQEIKANAHKVLPLPVPRLSEHWGGFMPGKLYVVLAQTTNGKSWFMSMLENQLAIHMTQKGLSDDRTIIHIDTEQTAETLIMNEIAMRSKINSKKIYSDEKIDWNKIISSSMKVGNINIHRIAMSMSRADVPPLHLRHIYHAIKYMMDKGVYDRAVNPALIVLDYLQALPVDQQNRIGDVHAQRRLQVREDVENLFKMARHFACPIIVGVQAKQKLENARGRIMIPDVYDGQETSAIAQRAAGMIGLWMPKTTNTVGDIFEHKDRGIRFRVRHDTMFVKILKQQGLLPSGMAEHYRVAFNDYQLHTFDDNEY